MCEIGSWRLASTSLAFSFSFVRADCTDSTGERMGSFQSELSLIGTFADMPEILAFVTQACDQARLNPALYFDLQLAVEEACANVIEHAYGGRGGDLRIRFETQARDIIITLQDHGRAFDPDRVAAPNLNRPLAKRPIGGLGLHLMYQLMDEIRFAFSDSGNTLVMVKRSAVLEDHAESPPAEVAHG